MRRLAQLTLAVLTEVSRHLPLFTPWSFWARTSVGGRS